MTQTQLNRAVAKVTNENVRTIRSLGFELAPDLDSGDSDSDQQCLWMDCPICRKPVLLSCQSAEELPEFAECLGCDTIFDFEQDEIYQTELDEVVALTAEIRRQCAAA